MAADSDTTWLESEMHDEPEPGERIVFGIIREAKVGDPGNTAFFIIDCSDGTMVNEEFVYPTLNPCDAVGSMVKLALSPDNVVGERRFQLIDEMRAARRVAQAAANERSKRRAREEAEKDEIRQRLLAQLYQRRRASGGTFVEAIIDYEIERVDKMSLKSLREVEQMGLDSLSAARISMTIPCEQGTVKLRMALDKREVGRINPLISDQWDFSKLHTHSSKVTIEVEPKRGLGRRLSATLDAETVEEIINGKLPSTETFWLMYQRLCAKKGLPVPNQ